MPGDEPGLVSFKDHFSRMAAQYARFRPTYPEPLFDYLAGLCPRRELAWDCACGAGQASGSLAQRFRRVVATDASAQQLAAAIQHEGVSYQVARAEESGLPSAAVDLITVAQALHWFDAPAFYAEVHRVLTAQGVLAVWSYGMLELHAPAMDAVIRHFYGSTVGPYWPAERALVDDGYRGLPFPFIELNPPTFSMQIQWALGQLLGYLRTWSATARYLDATGLDPVDALERELQPLWGDAGQLRQVSWPLALRVGRRYP